MIRKVWEKMIFSNEDLKYMVNLETVGVKDLILVRTVKHWYAVDPAQELQITLKNHILYNTFDILFQDRGLKIQADKEDLEIILLALLTANKKK